MFVIIRSYNNRICLGFFVVFLVLLQYVISFILNGGCIPDARGSTCSTKGSRLEAIGTASNTVDPADWISLFISLLMK